MKHEEIKKDKDLTYQVLACVFLAGFGIASAGILGLVLSRDRK